MSSGDDFINTVHVIGSTYIKIHGLENTGVLEGEDIFFNASKNTKRSFVYVTTSEDLGTTHNNAHD